MPPPRHVSKSRYCAGLQCLRRLWWEVHEPDAAELKPDVRLQAVFDRGHRVGELARERFAGGTLIDFEPWKVAERVQATSAAIRRGDRVVFEASFAAGGAFAALDVLEKRSRGWGVVEVKATLDVKPQFLPDIAVQVHAVRSAGVDVRRAELMHLNRECTFPDLRDLFVREDVTSAANELVRAVPRQLRRMRTALDGPLPEVEPGDQCHDPYDCPFAPRCRPELPPHHVSTLYRLNARRLAALVDSGYERIHDLPEDVDLPPVAARQVRAVRSRKLVVEPGLRDALSGIRPPVAFLDFESVNPAVPAWNGCRPFQHVPVQMSCHVVHARERTAHHEHLGEADCDPRPALAEAVVRACFEARTVVAYNARFERDCLAHLASAVPEQRRRLEAIRDRVVDLLPIVLGNVYHPEFRGSFGLKSVVPALVPGLGYDDLEVADGATASTTLEALLLAPERFSAAERGRVRHRLMAYCERDTLALARLYVALRALADTR